MDEKSSRPRQNYIKAAEKAKKSRKRRKHTQSKSESNQKQSATSTTSEDDDFEIPGYYYDRVKKKYFKILAYQHSHSANAITQKKLKIKQDEEKRQSFLVIDRKHNKIQGALSKNIVYHVNDRQLKGLSEEKPTLIKSMMQNWKMRGKQRVSSSVDGEGEYSRLEHPLFMLASPSGHHLMCVWSLTTSVVQRMQMLKVEEKQQSVSESLPIKVKPHGVAILQASNKVTDLCWGGGGGEDPLNSILYTTICMLGTGSSMALIRCLDSDSYNSMQCVDFNLGFKSAWTCAWDQTNKRFSIGSDKASYLMDVETRYMLEFKTKSRVYTQLFSSQTKQVLFSGTALGVWIHDLRSRSVDPVTKYHHKSCVSGLYLKQDENYLITSEFSGKIRLWDMRMNKCVCKYSGNSNGYTKLPFYVDESLGILHTVGQDSYTRIWDLQSTELMRTIAPPYTPSIDTIPRVLYSDSWGGIHGNYGFIMGAKDKIQYYGM